MTDSPDVAAALALLDTARDGGFAFQRIAPGPDGSLLGVRETEHWRDEIYLGGSGRRTRAAPPGAAARRWSCPVACRWPRSCAATP
ncbi:MAG: hypothetical protein ACRDRO_01285 [Pseudonocardiaceae bacterium]